MNEAMNIEAAAPEQFETKRLIARRVASQDKVYHVRLLTDRDVARTLGGVRTRFEVTEWHEAALEHWADHGFGEWLLFDRASGDFVGRVMLRYVDVGQGKEVELGYALMPAYWSKGLTTEAAEAALQIGFGQVGLGAIVCFALETNYASLRVIEKLGFEYSHKGSHAGLPHLFYRMSQDS